MKKNPSNNYPRIDIPDLKARCAGNWGMIFNALVADFDERLLDRAGRRHGPCPICGGEDRFQFFRDAPETGGCNCRHCGGKRDGFKLVSQANDWGFGETIREIDKLLGGGEIRSPKRRQKTPEQKQKEKEKREKERLRNRRLQQRLNKVWGESVAADAPHAQPMRDYCRNRGLNVESFSPMIRFHEGLESFDEEGNSEGVWPAMVAMVVDADGVFVTLHRTFLTPEGQKAPVKKAKKLMMYPSNQRASGGAIHLTGTGPILNVAEGIETGYAVQAMVGGSVWVTVNASMMANLNVGEPVEAVWVWSDLDRSGDGQKAARTLVERIRASGRQATLVVPPVPIPAGEKSVDWLDVYTQWHDSVATDKSRFIRRSQKRSA